MIAALRSIFLQAALVSGVIYLLLLIAEPLFPQFFPRPVTLQILALLFAVALIPRVLTWLIGLAIDRHRARKRRKT